jgi:DNA modification methylase
MKYKQKKEHMKNDHVAEGVQLYLPAKPPGLRTKNPRNEWGTFKDSLRAPIHGWFTYPAGFSYKAVEWGLRKQGLVPGDTVYDPFMGSGTTNVVAKKHGINSYGVEAHPFVYRVARAKMNWSVSREQVTSAVQAVRRQVQASRSSCEDAEAAIKDVFPELVLKCYEASTLRDLLFIREAILQEPSDAGLGDFLFVGLASLLRQVSAAATGWPYIAPKKRKNSSVGKDALVEYCRILAKMLDDIETTINEAAPNWEAAQHHIHLGDSRDTHGIIPDDTADMIFTSPPYLNNFDYADRTRLEMYFFGHAETWGDISRDVRTKLITSATTQISRDDPRYILSEEIAAHCPAVHEFLTKAVDDLSAVRCTKGGKKSYDHLVSGYFNDMFAVIRDCYRLLRRGGCAMFVLGDSAPYGVHIPTDALIGQIGMGLGFSDYTLDVLRARGDKWRANPQRHSVPLRESIVTLEKN